MKRQPFKSSNIKSAGFDVIPGEIEVEFHNGTVHRYSGCRSGDWEGMCKVRSPGQFFHRFIRRKKSRKLEAE